MTATLPPIRPVPRHRPAPLSFRQRRAWSRRRAEKGTTVSNVFGGCRILGALNVSALSRSLVEIVRRHEVLRTIFREAKGEPIQVVSSKVDHPLPVLDLEALSPAIREEEARRLAISERDHHFDLERGPLFRSTLLRLSAREHVLLLVKHHVITDGWSEALFLRELVTLQNAFSQGKPSPLPDLSIQYADFAIWQHKHLKGDVLERLLGYWKEQFRDGIPVLELPYDFPRASGFRSARHKRLLGGEVCQGVKALARAENATPFVVLLAVFKALLHLSTGQTDIPVATHVANRPRPEMQQLIGLFTNTLVLRTSLAGDLTWRELLRRVKRVVLGAYDHQDLPFQELLRELCPGREHAVDPLFPAAFVFQPSTVSILQAPVDLADLSFRPFDIGPGETRRDLAFLILETPRELQAEVVYRRDLFRAETVSRLLERYERLLEAAVSHPERGLPEPG